jgi:hypothetical protein
MPSGVKRDWFRKRLLRTGVPATALVKSVEGFSGEAGSGMRQLAWLLEVRVEGREPYELQGLLTGPPDTTSRIAPGDVVPVRVHPRKPKRVAIDWPAME